MFSICFEILSVVIYILVQWITHFLKTRGFFHINLTCSILCVALPNKYMVTDANLHEKCKSLRDFLGKTMERCKVPPQISNKLVGKRKTWKEGSEMMMRVAHALTFKLGILSPLLVVYMHMGPL